MGGAKTDIKMVIHGAVWLLGVRLCLEFCWNDLASTMHCLHRVVCTTQVVQLREGRAVTCPLSIPVVVCFR